MWGGLRFVEDDSVEPDYVIVLNQPVTDTHVFVDPRRVWAVIQEPPTRLHRYLHRGQPAYARTYTSSADLIDEAGRYRPSHPALPWHVNRTFDQLTQTPDLPAKTKDLSWITSTLGFLPGHRDRLAFIDKVQNCGVLDLFGRGLQPIADKWDGLAPYRYSIAFENYVGPYFWSEKLVDCFLAGAMPIYVGCTDLEQYFPAGSFVRIDPSSPNPAEALRRIVESDLAERSRDLVLEARRRCLFEHQLFPFVASKIAEDRHRPSAKAKILLRARRDLNPLNVAEAVWYWKAAPYLRRTFGR